MCPASRTWEWCSVMRHPSTKTCLIGMCPESSICRVCLLMQVLSSRRYAVRRGSTRRHRKSTCSPIHLAPYRIQCVVRGGCFGDLFIWYFFWFHFPPLTYPDILVDPKRSHTLMQSSTVALITDRHLHYPRSHIRTLMTLFSVFSPQTLGELKRAVDDCAQHPKADRI